MDMIKRIFYSMAALVSGMALLVSAAVQAGTGLGFPEKSLDEISANFLPGHEKFIDEATGDKWSVGYAKNELTPKDITKTRYFLGGYLKFPAQEATGIIDELWVRAAVLNDNSGRGAVAFAWIDAVGLMNHDVKLIREKLSDIIGINGLVSINVGVTHTHSAVDTQGLWGTIPKTGMDEEYMNNLVEKTAAAIRTAYENRTKGKLYYGSKDSSIFFTDGRPATTFDKNIHLLRFVPDDTAKKEVYITNFGAHPVNIERDITEISADFPYYVEKNVSEKYGADFIFIQGAVGGAINANLTSTSGISQDLSKYDRMKEYSKRVADTLKTLADSAKEVPPILNVRHAQLGVKVDNFIFKLADRTRICHTKAYKEGCDVKLTTEIGYAEIGKNIKILMMPGEAFPEIVYGGFLSADEACNKTEYPYAPLSTHFSEDDYVLTFGLCNDAIGYIIPDNDYSSSSKDGHSHEMISVGPTAASTVSGAFGELLAKYK